MRTIFNCFLFLLALLSGTAGAAHAQGKPVVYWPYFNLPPQFIVDRDRLEGMGIDVARELQKELPEYEHIFIPASPQRIDEELRTGRDRLVVTGLLRAPDREAYTLYSDTPCRMTFTMMIVMRREDLWRMAADGKGSLAYLTADQGLSFGYIPGVNYGPFNRYVNRLLSNAAMSRTHAAHSIGQLFDMLAAKRIDWFVHDTLGIWYAAGEGGMGDDIAVVEASECPPSPILGYFACPRSDQGAELMASINRAMARLVSSKQLYNVLKGWIPEPLGHAFEQAYASCFQPSGSLCACGGQHSLQMKTAGR